MSRVPRPIPFPMDNPFVGDAEGRDEIWVYGLPQCLAIQL